MKLEDFHVGMVVRASRGYPPLRPPFRPRSRGIVRTFYNGSISVEWDGLKGREYLSPECIEPADAKLKAATPPA